jgi:serine/threonine protein kinase
MLNARLHPNSQLLVDSLAALPMLDGRFEKLQLVNVDSVKDERKGCYSLVFRAWDTLNTQFVALKFYDPGRLTEVYRVLAFRREHELLKLLSSSNTGLQLASGLNIYQLPISAQSGAAMPCEYFGVEWLEDEVEHYFLRQEAHSPVEKLKVFRKIVRAVAELHARGIFHRDLKPDNLRCKKSPSGASVVVCIDLGTAARLSSANLQAAYSYSVGASGYSAPEANCGLSGIRSLAPFTDQYALGCMLFELFNRDYFFRTFEEVNRHYQAHFGLLAAQVAGLPESEQITAWCRAMDKLGPAFSPVKMDGVGNSVPPGIAPLLNEVLGKLTHVDYRCRPEHLSWVMRRIDSAILVLANERRYQARLAYAKEMRRRRLARQLEREQRLKLAQSKGLLIC